MKNIDVIVPVHNEEGNIGTMFQRLNAVFQTLPFSCRFIFVDDGSTDKTLSILKALSKADPRVDYISFSKNFGHQNAIKAGLDRSTGDCAITLDGDLQHPPELIPELIQRW